MYSMSVGWSSAATPTTMAAAEYLSDIQKRRKEIDRRIDANPSGIIASPLKFGANMAIHAMDPVNLISGAAVGVAFKAKGIMQASKAMSAPKRLGLEFARETTENAIGNALTETVNMAQTRNEQGEYTLKGYAENVMYGALGGAAVVPGPGGCRAGGWCHGDPEAGQERQGQQHGDEQAHQRRAAGGAGAPASGAVPERWMGAAAHALSASSAGARSTRARSSA